MSLISIANALSGLPTSQVAAKGDSDNLVKKNLKKLKDEQTPPEDRSQLKDFYVNLQNMAKTLSDERVIFPKEVIEFIENDLDKGDLPATDRDMFILWLANFLKEKLNENQAPERFYVEIILMAQYWDLSGRDPETLKKATNDEMSLPSLIRKYKPAILRVQEVADKSSLAPDGDKFFYPWLVEQFHLGIQLKVKPPDKEEIIWVRDWYVGANKKKKVNEYDFAQAHAESNEWHEMGAGSDDTASAYITPVEKNMVYSGHGFIISELSKDKLSPEEIENDCVVEGNLMKNCVGSIHTRMVREGREKIFSLREASPPHIPRVTIQFIDGKIKEIKEYQNKQLTNDAYKIPVFDWLIENFTYLELYGAEGDVIRQIPEELEEKIYKKWDQNSIKFYRASKYGEPVDPKSLDYKKLDSKLLSSFINAVSPTSIMQSIAARDSGFIDDRPSIKFKKDYYSADSAISDLADVLQYATESTVQKLVAFIEGLSADFDQKFETAFSMLSALASKDLDKLKKGVGKSLLTGTMLGMQMSLDMGDGVDSMSESSLNKFINWVKDKEQVRQAMIAHMMKARGVGNATKVLFDKFPDMSDLPELSGSTLDSVIGKIKNEIVPTRRWYWPDWVREKAKDSSETKMKSGCLNLLFRSRDEKDLKLANSILGVMENNEPEQAIRVIADSIHITGKEPFIELYESNKGNPKFMERWKSTFEHMAGMTIGNILSSLNGYEFLKYVPVNREVYHFISEYRNAIGQIPDRAIETYSKSFLENLDPEKEILDVMNQYRKLKPEFVEALDRKCTPDKIVKMVFKSVKGETKHDRVMGNDGFMQTVKSQGPDSIMVHKDNLEKFEKAPAGVKVKLLEIWDAGIENAEKENMGKMESYLSNIYCREAKDPSVLEVIKNIRKSLEVAKTASYQIVKIAMEMAR